MDQCIERENLNSCSELLASRCARGASRAPRAAPQADESQAGIALVETALLIPIVALLLFAIIEFGLAFARYQVATNATAAAARAAGSFRTDCSNGKVTTAAENAAKVYARTLGLTEADLKPSVVGEAEFDSSNTDGDGLCRSPTLIVTIRYQEEIPIVSNLSRLVAKNSNSAIAGTFPVSQQVAEFNENSVSRQSSSSGN